MTRGVSVNSDGGGRILIAGGDSGATATLADVLGGVHRCTSCRSGGDAYAWVRRTRFDVVIADAELDDVHGLELLDMVRGLGDPPAMILLFSGATCESVRHAFKRGVFDVVSDASDVDEVRNVVANAVACGRPTDRRAAAFARGRSAVETDGGSPSACATRRAFVAALARERSVCRRHDSRASVLVLDVDDAGADDASCGLSGREPGVGGLCHALEQFSDAVAAIGTFGPRRTVLALRDADEDAAADLADRVRRAVRGPTDRHAHRGRGPRLRIGVASTQPGFIETGEDLIERATAASVWAKELGGNQTVRWSEVSTLGPSRRQLAAASVEEVSCWISRSRQQLKRGYIESTMALVAAVEAKEPHTREHARVVSRYCEEIGRWMELPAGQLDALRTAGLLHDIGKIGVPDAILQKPGPLTPEEFDVVKRHPETAIDILGHTSFLRTELPYIRHHHERYDGGGYPSGLRGDEIPLGARILNVGDSLDAMLSTRCYRRGLSLEQVQSELYRCSGTQFDPEVARMAADWLDHDRSTITRSVAGSGEASRRSRRTHTAY